MSWARLGSWFTAAFQDTVGWLACHAALSVVAVVLRRISSMRFLTVRTSGPQLGSRVRAYEHRAIGDAATGAALVNVGGESAEERFLLSFGDVVALSGDYFRPHGSPTPGLEHRQADPPRADGSGRLFSLACAPGESGIRLDTRDEIICALKVTTVDEVFVDPRFEPSGQFADFRFHPGAARSDVERRVRDRYLALAASNDDHFVTLGRSDVATGSGFGSALLAYRNLHQVALDQAWRLGREGGDVSRALGREAAAAHYLTDAFAAGHLRTPVAAIRRSPAGGSRPRSILSARRVGGARLGRRPRPATTAAVGPARCPSRPRRAGRPRRSRRAARSGRHLHRCHPLRGAPLLPGPSRTGTPQQLRASGLEDYLLSILVFAGQWVVSV